MSAFLDDIEEAVKIAVSYLEVDEKDLKKLLPDIGPGFRRPNKRDLPKFLAQKRMEYPPDDWVLPDGREVFESIYILALANVEGGKEILKQVRDMTEEAY